MIQKNYVVFVNADGCVNLYERVYDDIAQSSRWVLVPVDVIAEPQSTPAVAITEALLTLVGAAIPFVGAVLMAMVDLSAGVA